MLVHTGKYRTEDEIKFRQYTETKHNAEKANNVKYSKTKLQSPLVQSPFITLSHETRRAYSTTLPSPYRAQ